MRGQKTTYIIAEAGVNHNGSLDLALQLIEVAAAAGADAVKFQTFKAERLAVATAPKADYQEVASGAGESQYDMLRGLELDEAAHRRLQDHCRAHRIQFLSTPFDIESAQMLAARFDLPCLKLPSGEITNGPLLLAVARTGKPVILSTGMSTLAEVEAALGVLAFGFLGHGGLPALPRFAEAFREAAGQAILREKVRLLHCTSEYPAPCADVNLLAMDTLAATFGLPVGLSDHTTGIAISIAAVARGATIIEKHFTLDRELPGPDHRASLVPEELRALVRSIREVEAALGDGIKEPAASERKNLPIVRKSLVTLQEIRRGEAFTEENLGVKRPGDGVSPMRYWDWLGQTASRDYRTDEKVEP